MGEELIIEITLRRQSLCEEGTRGIQKIRRPVQICFISLLIPDQIDDVASDVGVQLDAQTTKEEI